MIARSLKPVSVFKNATTNVLSPPYATDHATAIHTNLLNGGYVMISFHGTGVRDAWISAGASASGTRRKKLKLMPAMAALKANSSANCQAFGCTPKTIAAMLNTRKLPIFMHAASRTK